MDLIGKKEIPKEERKNVAHSTRKSSTKENKDRGARMKL